MYSSSNSRALPSSKKTHSEKHKQILKQLLKEADNRTCVDCKTATHPRWASWNLGCFMCIRCSGIHRSMGTHISKVKSVDLDAWTDEQVESMVKWGNEKCNTYWEDKLPDGYVPDQSKIENFVRTKYDMKKWVASSTVPDPMTMSKKATSASASTPEVSGNHGSGKGFDLLQDNSAIKSNSTKSTPALSTNLLDDDFGSFTSASTPSVPAKPKVSSHSPINNNPLPSIPIQTSGGSFTSPQGTGGSMSNGRPDLKKSILSLYSSPSSSSSSFTNPNLQQMGQHQNNQTYPRQPYSSNQPQAPDTNSLSNSLQGLSFNTSSKSNSTLGQNKPSTPAMSDRSSQSSINLQNNKNGSSQSVNQNSWNNEWSDIGSQRNTWTSSQPKVNTSNLDDDLFKNVWK